MSACRNCPGWHRNLVCADCGAIVEHAHHCGGQVHGQDCPDPHELKGVHVTCPEPEEVTRTGVARDVDGYVDDKGIEYIGKAYEMSDGTWRCLANVLGALCLVEASVTCLNSEEEMEVYQNCEGEKLVPGGDGSQVTCPACDGKGQI